MPSIIRSINRDSLVSVLAWVVRTDSSCDEIGFAESAECVPGRAWSEQGSLAQCLCRKWRFALSEDAIDQFRARRLLAKAFVAVGCAFQCATSRRIEL